MTPHVREMRRIDHLVEVIHTDGVKVMKWQWLRTGLAAFIVPFITILLATDQPITKNLIVSAVIAGLAAAVRAIDPQVRLSLVERHLDDAHTNARFDWDPADVVNKSPMPRPPLSPTEQPPTTQE